MMPASKILVAVIVIVASTTALAARQQKPVVTGDVNSDYARPPETMARLVASADVIVQAVVTGNRNVVYEHGGHSQAKTEYTLQVIDSIKGTLQAGRLVTLLRSGGDIDAGSEIRRSVEPGFMPFHRGEQYLVFLHWNAGLNVYEVIYGPNGVFQINAGTVSAIGKSPLSLSLHGQPLIGVATNAKNLLRGAR